MCFSRKSDLKVKVPESTHTDVENYVRCLLILITTKTNSTHFCEEEAKTVFDPNDATYVW